MAKFHPDKEISDVIKCAIDLGWAAVKGTGHCYCTLRCPAGDRSGCQYRVFLHSEELRTARSMAEGEN